VFGAADQQNIVDAGAGKFVQGMVDHRIRPDGEQVFISHLGELAEASALTACQDYATTLHAFSNLQSSSKRLDGYRIASRSTSCIPQIERWRPTVDCLNTSESSPSALPETARRPSSQVRAPPSCNRWHSAGHDRVDLSRI